MSPKSRAHVTPNPINLSGVDVCVSPYVPQTSLKFNLPSTFNLFLCDGKQSMFFSTLFNFNRFRFSLFLLKIDLHLKSHYYLFVNCMENNLK